MACFTTTYNNMWRQWCQKRACSTLGSSFLSFLFRRQLCVHSRLPAMSSNRSTSKYMQVDCILYGQLAQVKIGENFTSLLDSFENWLERPRGVAQITRGSLFHSTAICVPDRAVHSLWASWHVYFKFWIYMHNGYCTDCIILIIKI